MMQSDQAGKRVRAALASGEKQVVLEPVQFRTGFQNELLFFFKPEVFLPGGGAHKLEKVFDLAFSMFRQFEVLPSGMLFFSGARLEELGIMDRHYGYINRLSKNASGMVTSQDVEKMAGLVEEDIRGLPVLGGHEALSAVPGMSVEALTGLWMGKKFAKVRSGFYVQPNEFGGRRFLLVNGFHPMQLQHFTAPGRVIVVLLVHSNRGWKSLKEELVGETQPEKALHDSLRGRLFHHPERYDADEVNVSRNYVHLSAGPFEAFFEIWNFLKDAGMEGFDLAKTNVGRAAGSDNIQRLLQNPQVEKDGKSLDLFSASENLDTGEALKLA